MRLQNDTMIYFQVFGPYTSAEFLFLRGLVVYRYPTMPKVQTYFWTFICYGFTMVLCLIVFVLKFGLLFVYFHTNILKIIVVEVNMWFCILLVQNSHNNMHIFKHHFTTCFLDDFQSSPVIDVIVWFVKIWQNELWNLKNGCLCKQ